MIIKRYNQFVKNKLNENLDIESEELIDDEVESDIMDHDDIYQNEYQEPQNINDIEEEEMEEEGGEYIGQKMMQELADSLDVQIETDGSIIYNDKKINFFSETEKFHVDKKKFSTIDEVLNYLKSSEDSNSDNELEKGEDFSEEIIDGLENELEDKFESKSYKQQRLKKLRK